MTPPLNNPIARRLAHGRNQPLCRAPQRSPSPLWRSVDFLFGVALDTACRWAAAGDWHVVSTCIRRRLMLVHRLPQCSSSCRAKRHWRLHKTAKGRALAFNSTVSGVAQTWTVHNHRRYVAVLNHWPIYSAVPCAVTVGSATAGKKKNRPRLLDVSPPPATGPPCFSEQPPARYRRLFARRLRLFPPPSPKKASAVPCPRPHSASVSSHSTLVLFFCSGRRPRCLASIASHPRATAAAPSRRSLAQSDPTSAAKLNIASLS